MHIHFSGVAFHVLCFGLGFHVVIGVGRLVVRFHHAYVIPSFLLDVVVRLCLVIVNSDCDHNHCMLHIAKTGPLRCCPYNRELIETPSWPEYILSTQWQTSRRKWSHQGEGMFASSPKLQRSMAHGRARAREKPQPGRSTHGFTRQCMKSKGRSPAVPQKPDDPPLSQLVQTCMGRRPRTMDQQKLAQPRA